MSNNYFSPDEGSPTSNDKPVPERIEKRVRRQAGHKCTGCGRSATSADSEDGENPVALELHHQVPRSEGGTNRATNLTLLCERCHRWFHRFINHGSDPLEGAEAGKPGLQAIYEGEQEPDEDRKPTSLLEAMAIGEFRLGLTQADHQILYAVHHHGPCPISVIADEIDASRTTTYNRVHHLASGQVLMQSRNNDQWNFAGRVEDPLRGHLPEDREQANRLLRDQVALEMRDEGHSFREIAEALDIHRSTVRVALDRAEAFEPPVDPLSAIGVDPSDMSAD